MDLTAELRLRRSRRQASTRPPDTGADRGCPLYLARLWHGLRSSTTVGSGAGIGRSNAVVEGGKGHWWTGRRANGAQADAVRV